MRIKQLILLALFGLFFNLSACGQKGPLILPEQTSSTFYQQ